MRKSTHTHAERAGMAFTGRAEPIAGNLAILASDMSRRAVLTPPVHMVFAEEPDATARIMQLLRWAQWYGVVGLVCTAVAVLLGTALRIRRVWLQDSLVPGTASAPPQPLDTHSIRRGRAAPGPPATGGAKIGGKKLQ